MTNHYDKIEGSELGKKSNYETTYNPSLLFPIPRKKNRDAIGVDSNKLPFYGMDFWNHYEVSWLNEKGKPVVALAEIIYDCETVSIIESKSMKLYFNSFNNSAFKSVDALQAIIKQDLEKCLNSHSVTVKIIPLSLYKEEVLYPRLRGVNIDELDIECHTYSADVSFLTTESEVVEETLCTDLLKSNCLVTNQPDWCSVQITYKGKKINRAGLLRYIVSFRNDNEFHEQCIEKIFVQIMKFCQPSELTVYGRSTRRGGLDINSRRSSKPIKPSEITNHRLCRQ